LKTIWWETFQLYVIGMYLQKSSYT
jgi:hypothetical protein